MDPISYGVAAKQKQRIEKVIAEPDSTSGVITVPQVIAAGETITVPAGRTAVLPNVQVDGTLNVQGDVFIPSGATMSKVVEKVASTDNAVVRFNGTTGEVQNSGVIIDDSGNVGIGVTPSAWTNKKAIQIGVAGSLSANINDTPTVYLSSNVYTDGTWADRYISTAPASSLVQYNGSFIWSTAPSGTAGNAITWNNAMTLDNNQLGLKVFQFNAYGYGANNTFEFVQRTANKGFDWYVNAGSIRAMDLDSNGNLSHYNGGIYSFGANGIMSTDYASSSIQIRRWAQLDTNYVLQSLVLGSRTSAILANGSFQSATNSYGSTSDIKLKENVVDATPKLEKLMQVKVRNFNYIGDEHKQIGVVAQEIEQIFPSIVYETKDTKQVEVEKKRIVPAIKEVKDDEGNVIQEAKPESIEKYIEIETVETGETTKNVKYSVIYMMMLKAMQEQQEIINDLKARVEVLEAK